MKDPEIRFSGELREGERVYYRGGWGKEPPRETKITGSGTKNGRVVYDNDLEHWGYEYQYKRELPFPDPFPEIRLA